MFSIDWGHSYTKEEFIKIHNMMEEYRKYTVEDNNVVHQQYKKEKSNVK